MPRKIIDLSTPIDVGHLRWPVERRTVKSHAAGDTAEATFLGWVVHGRPSRRPRAKSRQKRSAR